MKKILFILFIGCNLILSASDFDSDLWYSGSDNGMSCSSSDEEVVYEQLTVPEQTEKMIFTAREIKRLARKRESCYVKINKAQGILTLVCNKYTEACNNKKRYDTAMKKLADRTPRIYDLTDETCRLSSCDDSVAFNNITRELLAQFGDEVKFAEFNVLEAQINFNKANSELKAICNSVSEFQEQFGLDEV